MSRLRQGVLRILADFAVRTRMDQEYLDIFFAVLASSGKSSVLLNTLQSKFS